jgi:hypothetical protein
LYAIAALATGGLENEGLPWTDCGGQLQLVAWQGPRLRAEGKVVLLLLRVLMVKRVCGGAAS